MRKIFLITGIALSTTAIFAQQFGIDNDLGWGRKRVLLLTAGAALVVFGLLLFLFQKNITKLKKDFLEFKNTNFNFNYSTQLAIVSFVTTILIMIVYIWFAQPFKKDPNDHYNYYSELAIGFKTGHLYLPEKPSPALLSLSNPYDYFLRKETNVEDFPWDVSLYNNKFYIYWGPAPSLILTIFSKDQLHAIEDRYLVLLFACGLFFYAMLISVTFWKKSIGNPPSWLLGISLLVIGLAAPVTIMLRDSRIYEAAVFGCQFFFIGGCYWAYSSINNDKPVLWKLAFASLHWAFALGTRVTILPAILFSAAVLFIYILKVFKPATLQTITPILAAIGVPLLMAVSGLSWYNWARFESIFEFGIKYQLTNVDYNIFQDSFSSRYIRVNLFNYFVHPLKLLSKFPFIARVEYTPSNDRLAGLIYISPYLFLLFPPLIRMLANLPAAKKSIVIPQPKEPSDNWLIFTFTGSALISMLTILSFYFVAMRYIEDFMPSLLLLTTILLVREYQRLSQHKLARDFLGGTAITLAIFTISASILLAMPKNGIAFMENLLNSVSKILGLK